MLRRMSPRPRNLTVTRPSASERATGIEPALSAWEADVLPLNYARERLRSRASQHSGTLRRVANCRRPHGHRAGAGEVPEPTPAGPGRTAASRSGAGNVRSMAPEPTDVGPMYGGHLRVSDADRHQAVRLLDAARADGRLTEADHRERTALAARAVTFDDIVPVTRDLVATADMVAVEQALRQFRKRFLGRTFPVFA